MHLRCMTLFGLCAQDYFSRAGHELLDWLGFIFDPADVINFLWYTAEGNAAMAAATAVAIVPAAGSFIAKGTKQAIKAGKKAAQKAGEKAAKNAAEKAAKKAAKKKLAKEAGKEAAEKGAEKAAKEAAEKATEKTAKETAEKTAKEATEKGIKSGSFSKGVGNPVEVVGRGSTGRTVPNTLNEQMAMHQVMSNPLEGAVDMSQLKNHPVIMSDSRWLASEGWVKMSNNVNGVEIHFVYNKITGAFDDFKFK